MAAGAASLIASSLSVISMRTRPVWLVQTTEYRSGFARAGSWMLHLMIGYRVFACCFVKSKQTTKFGLLFHKQIDLSEGKIKTDREIELFYGELDLSFDEIKHQGVSIAWRVLITAGTNLSFFEIEIQDLRSKSR